MSGQFSASLSLDELTGPTSTTSTPAPHDARPPAASLSDTGTDGHALEAAPPASAWRRRGTELRLQAGILLYLACIAFVGTAIIVGLFGTAFSLLGHPTAEVIVNSGARDRQLAPVGAKPEMPMSGTTLSVVPPRSAPTRAAGEMHASAAPKAPFGSDLPTAATTAPGTSPVMTALAAPEPDSTPPSIAGTQPGQNLRPNATAETAGVQPEPSLDPITGQGAKHSRLKQPVNASAEIVHGIVAKALDAMTWVVDDQIVNLWGIRPGSPNLSPSFIGFVDLVRTKGVVECRRQTHSSRYRCLMATGEDLAEAALLAGVGRAADGATVAYRAAEAQAHQRAVGLRARP
jgi:hypothetical protein